MLVLLNVMVDNLTISLGGVLSGGAERGVEPAHARGHAAGRAGQAGRVTSRASPSWRRPGSSTGATSRWREC